MLLPLAGALAVALLAEPKTSGAYVDARFAECVTSGACGSRDMLLPSARFTGNQLAADWVQEALTVAWRATAAGLEVRGKGDAGWRQILWEERTDGTVWTEALLRDAPDLLQ